MSQPDRQPDATSSEQRIGYWIEFKRGWWATCLGPNKDLKDSQQVSGSYHGSITEEQAKDLEKIVSDYLDKAEQPPRLTAFGMRDFVARAIAYWRTQDGPHAEQQVVELEAMLRAPRSETREPHMIADAATAMEKSYAFEWLRGVGLGTKAALDDKNTKRLAMIALDEWHACKERADASAAPALLRVLEAARDYTTEREYQNVDACQKDQDRREGILIAAIHAADNALRSAPVSATRRSIEAMVDRFLSWKLPQDFSPDSGITFKPHPHPNAWPIGTNLLNADQAKAMLEHVLGGEK